MYVEQDCCIKHEGRKFCAGGAVVTPDEIIAYPNANGDLADWHGKPLGTWRVTAQWPIHSYMSEYMFQIEARVEGILYTGRGLGIGMIYRGKRKARQ